MVFSGPSASVSIRLVGVCDFLSKLSQGGLLLSCGQKTQKCMPSWRYLAGRVRAYIFIRLGSHTVSIRASRICAWKVKVKAIGATTLLTFLVEGGRPTVNCETITIGDLDFTDIFAM